ncbi:acyltransferase [Ruminococcus albus]|uniref:Conserved domain protein n=2 Tax=Ruminococcus TaxID=1263 RepID=E9SAX4_RUMAL|nr:acyltransferase [Ruminococcus albus]EGC03527.1 conserved domain protein [Ruminococcus albus 8]
MGKTKENKSGRILYMSRLKALACLSIIIFHGSYMATAFAVKQGADGQRVQDTELMTVLMSVRNLFMWAVPVFVMVTGALLLDEKRSIPLKKLFGKYLLRVVIALFAAGEIFTLYDHLVYFKDFTPHHLLDGLKTALLNRFTATGNSWSHTWYLYLMIAIYLSLPLLRPIAKAGKKEVLYAIALCFAFGAVGSTIDFFFGVQSPVYYIFIDGIYPMYLFAGFAIHNGKLKIPRAAAVMTTVINAGAILWATYYRFHTTNEELASQLKNSVEKYSFPFVALAALSIFALFKSSDSGKEIPILDKIVSEVDKCSFGIYLIHMLVYKHIFAVMKTDPFANGGFLTLLLIMLVTFVISYAVTRILKFIPFVKNIV